MSELIRWRPTPAVRKTLLLVHIAAAGAWLGFDLVLGVLTVTVLTAGAAPSAAAAVSIAAFTTWPLLTSGLVTLVTGIVLGVGSKYGLIRYWWVLAKLVLNVALSSLVLVLLLPGVETLRGAGLAALATGTTPDAPPTMLFPPIVSSTAVVFAIALSVFKPWGRVRRTRTVNGMPTPAPPRRPEDVRR